MPLFLKSANHKYQSKLFTNLFERLPKQLFRFITNQ